MERDDERTWTELVESFHASPDDAERTWPDAENVDSGTAISGFDSSPDSSATTTRPGLGDSGTDSVRERGGETEDKATPTEAGEPAAHARSHEPPRPNDDEHFVPPTPPPIPRTDMITMLAWFGVFGTPVLFAVAYVFGQSVPGLVSLIAVTAFVGGFALLISRLRGHDPHDPDSGAVV